jgi:hypothetical protein
MTFEKTQRSYINAIKSCSIAEQPGSARSVRLRKSERWVLLESETQIVRPGSTVSWYVFGPPGDRVVIDLERVLNSGGHHHGGGPTGAVNPPRITLGPNYPQNVRVSYRAPPASGLVRITFRFSSGATDIDYNQVMIDNLLPLRSSSSIVLVGGTPTHPDNHYGSPALVSKISALADQFKAQYSSPIYVNDMSLQWGGLFDYRAQWGTPHQTHREGRHVDIRSVNMTKEEKDFFKSSAVALGFRIMLENEGLINEHWHLGT